MLWVGGRGRCMRQVCGGLLGVACVGTLLVPCTTCCITASNRPPRPIDWQAPVPPGCYPPTAVLRAIIAEGFTPDQVNAAAQALALSDSFPLEGLTTTLRSIGAGATRITRVRNALAGSAPVRVAVTMLCVFCSLGSPFFTGARCSSHFWQ